jgi:hypothetical protein
MRLLLAYSPPYDWPVMARVCGAGALDFFEPVGLMLILTLC